MAFGMKGGTIQCDNASGFLAPVLQCVQTQRGQCGSVAVAKYAEDTAFFMEFVGIHNLIPEVRLVR